MVVDRRGHRLFAQWMDEHAPGRAVSIALYIPYDQAEVADVPLPRGCQRHAFVHIGYAEGGKPLDVYAITGPVIATDRLTRTVQYLKARHVTGVVAYSEGEFDDVNKALLGGMFRGTYPAGRPVILAYAKRYFRADDDQARQWADWLIPWGHPLAVDAIAAPGRSRPSLRRSPRLAPATMATQGRDVRRSSRDRHRR